MSVERIVVKYGSSCLVDKKGVSQRRINGYTEQLRQVSEKRNLVVVTSGAVAVGRRHWQEYDNEPFTDEDYQVLAAMGSAGVSEAWRKGFKRSGILSGQILVTHSELETSEGAKLRKTYNRMRELGVTPVINQNDALVRKGEKGNELDKLKVGADNDWLAVDLAKCLGAQTLVLCTSGVEGMTIGDEVLHQVRTARIPALQELCHEANGDGTGGMGSKLEAAGDWVSASAMNRAYICNAAAELEAMLNGAQIGTEVLA